MHAVPLSQVAVRLSPEDNVAVAARHLAAGTEIAVNGTTITIAFTPGVRAPSHASPSASERTRMAAAARPLPSLW